MKQPQKTLVYAKALQYWVEKALPSHPGKPCQLAEISWELQHAMEPLATFMDMEVLGDNLPPNWKMINPSRPTEPEWPDQGSLRERSHSRSWRAHARGTFAVTHGMGCSKPTATTWAVSPSPVPTQKVESLQETSSWQWTSPPGFTEIARSLWGDDPPHPLKGDYSMPTLLGGEDMDSD